MSRLTEQPTVHADAFVAAEARLGRILDDQVAPRGLSGIPARIRHGVISVRVLSAWFGGDLLAPDSDAAGRVNP
jgi:hypothetical protein